MDLLLMDRLEAIQAERSRISTKVVVGKHIPRRPVQKQGMGLDAACRSTAILAPIDARGGVLVEERRLKRIDRCLTWRLIGPRHRLRGRGAHEDPLSQWAQPLALMLGEGVDDLRAGMAQA